MLKNLLYGTLSLACVAVTILSVITAAQFLHKQQAEETFEDVVQRQMILEIHLDRASRTIEIQASRLSVIGGERDEFRAKAIEFKRIADQLTRAYVEQQGVIDHLSERLEEALKRYEPFGEFEENRAT